jgi:multisubunit Na+/H+ antiporter MnhB subunit
MGLIHALEGGIIGLLVFAIAAVFLGAGLGDLKNDHSRIIRRTPATIILMAVGASATTIAGVLGAATLSYFGII